MAIVGDVGSGKSSLLSCLTGEMVQVGGQGVVSVSGSLAYAPQTPWILNSSLRNNVTFGKTYFEKYYRQVLKACGLDIDCNLLAANDMTEIGEKGSNLSGGQKQRVSLARAIYSNSDVILLDDPLSSVDAKLAKSIFDEVIGPNGMTKTKTRLLVTSDLGLLKHTDMVIVMKNGSVEQAGTFDEIQKSKSELAQLLSIHSAGSDQDQEGTSRVTYFC